MNGLIQKSKTKNTLTGVQSIVAPIVASISPDSPVTALSGEFAY